MMKSRCLLAMALALLLAAFCLSAREAGRRLAGEAAPPAPAAGDRPGSVARADAPSERASGDEALSASAAAPPSGGGRAAPSEKEGVARPRLALIIDDFGYSGNIASRVARLNLRATWSVIPEAPHAEAIAKLAARIGQPYILHIPMQARDDAPGSRNYQIGVETTEAAMRAYIDRLRRRFPGALGANNHRGSRATSDRETMRRFMRVYAATGWGFIDSRTTAKSAVERAAREYRVPVASNALFLDGTTDLRTMKRQFAKALRIARKRGAAAAICHAREKTMPFLAYVSTLDTAPVVLATADEIWGRHEPSRDPSKEEKR